MSSRLLTELYDFDFPIWKRKNAVRFWPRKNKRWIFGDNLHEEESGYGLHPKKKMTTVTASPPPHTHTQHTITLSFSSKWPHTKQNGLSGRGRCGAVCRLSLGFSAKRSPLNGNEPSATRLWVDQKHKQNCPLCKIVCFSVKVPVQIHFGWFSRVV